MKRRDMRCSNAYNSLPDTKEMTFDEICPESRRAARITLIYRKSYNEPCYRKPIIECTAAPIGTCLIGAPCIDEFYIKHQPD